MVEQAVEKEAGDSVGVEYFNAALNATLDEGELFDSTFLSELKEEWSITLWTAHPEALLQAKLMGNDFGNMTDDEFSQLKKVVTTSTNPLAYIYMDIWYHYLYFFDHL